MSGDTDEGWTSIPVRPSTRDGLSDIKRDSESWNDVLQRLTGSQEGGTSKKTTEA